MSTNRTFILDGHEGESAGVCSVEALRAASLSVKRRNAWTRALLHALLLLAAVMMLGVFDVLIDLHVGLRAAAAVCVIAGLVRIIRTLIGGRQLCDREVIRAARQIEVSSGLLHNPLVIAAQCTPAASESGLTHTLRTRSESLARSAIHSEAGREAVQKFRGSGRAWGGVAALGLLLTAATFALWKTPGALGTEAQRLLLPWGAVRAWAPVSLAMHARPANEGLRVGDDAAVTIDIASGGDTSTPTLRTSDGILVPLVPTAPHRFEAKLGPLQGPVELQATATWLERTIYSDALRIEPTALPRILAATATVRGPAYAAGDERTFDLLDGAGSARTSCAVLAGGSIELAVTAASPLAVQPGVEVRGRTAVRHVVLALPGHQRVELPVRGGADGGQHTSGATDQSEVVGIDVTVLPDARPIACLDVVGAERAATPLKPGEPVRLRVRISDDAGVGWAGLGWKTHPLDAAGMVELVTAPGRSPREIDREYELDPLALGLERGGEVFLWVAACDNRPDELGGAQATLSGVISVCWQGATDAHGQRARAKDGSIAASGRVETGDSENDVSVMGSQGTVASAPGPAPAPAPAPAGRLEAGGSASASSTAASKSGHTPKHASSGTVGLAKAAGDGAGDGAAQVAESSAQGAPASPDSGVSVPDSLPPVVRLTAIDGKSIRNALSNDGAIGDDEFASLPPEPGCC